MLTVSDITLTQCNSREWILSFRANLQNTQSHSVDENRHSHMLHHTIIDY